MNLFLHDKPTRILLRLKEREGNYASLLSKKTDCTYTHTLKILTQLKTYHIVEFEKKGRIKEVHLTSMGEDIAHELEGLFRQIEKLNSKLEEDFEQEQSEQEE